MKKLAARLEIVTFHGHRMDIKNCIYGLDATVMCSDHEGLPMTALESLAIRTPIIAHKVGGLIQLMKETPERLIVAHNASGYAKVFFRVISNTKSKSVYPQYYNIRNTSHLTSTLYLQLLNN
jgi:glycosyltransferase involved in cell wall biosynthesis